MRLGVAPLNTCPVRFSFSQCTRRVVIRIDSASNPLSRLHRTVFRCRLSNEHAYPGAVVGVRGVLPKEAVRQQYEAAEQQFTSAPELKGTRPEDLTQGNP